jgi:hypothetical protein
VPPTIPRQPFDKRIGDNVEEWTVKDEAERLDRLGTLTAQASLALAAGAVGTGFSLERHGARIFVFAVAAACGTIALAAGVSLSIHPMRHVSRGMQEKSLHSKLRVARVAGVTLGFALPLVGIVIATALFAPNGQWIFVIASGAFILVNLPATVVVGHRPRARADSQRDTRIAAVMQDPPFLRASPCLIGRRIVGLP